MGTLNVRLCGEVTLDLPNFFAPALERAGGALTTRLLIGGRWREAAGGEVFEDRSPIDGSVVARVAKASKEDVEAAIAAARQARDGFRGLPASARLEICQRGADILADHFDSFVATIVADLGKTPEQATSEVKTTGERLGLVREEVRKIFGEYVPGDWMAESAGKSAIVLREPVGTVGAFGPFNYPCFSWPRRSSRPSPRATPWWPRPLPRHRSPWPFSPACWKKRGYPQGCSTSSPAPVARSARRWLRIPTCR